MTKFIDVYSKSTGEKQPNPVPEYFPDLFPDLSRTPRQKAADKASATKETPATPEKTKGA